MVFDIEKVQEERREKRGRERKEQENRFTFDVLMFTPERGDFSTKVTTSTNDPELAKQIALDREKVKGRCEVTVVPLPFNKSP